MLSCLKIECRMSQVLESQFLTAASTLDLAEMSLFTHMYSA